MMDCFKKGFLALIVFAMLSGFGDGFNVAIASEAETAKSVKARQATRAEILAKKQGRRRDSQNYIIEPGDRVRITIYPPDEFIQGGEILVSTDGKIALSLIGKINIAGMGVLEVERMLTEIIDRDYLVNPEVVVEIKKEVSEATFLVLGAVKKPGTHRFPVGKKRIGLLEAISSAGGFSNVANIKKIKIVRSAELGEKKEVIRANAESIMSGNDPDIHVNADDIIHVAESLF